VNDGIGDLALLIEHTGLSKWLIVQVLGALEAHGYIRVVRFSGGAMRVIDVKPSLKRWLRDA
jgi:hypothetical protein